MRKATNKVEWKTMGKTYGYMNEVIRQKVVCRFKVIQVSTVIGIAVSAWVDSLR